MAGIDPNRLVLIRWKAEASGASDRFGTGYFITQDLVLTASHVVEGTNAVDIRVEAAPGWAGGTVIWRDDQLDAALIRHVNPPAMVGSVRWATVRPTDNVAWTSTGYPIAAAIHENGVVDAKTSGLSGTLYAQGGGGQGARELELSVEAAPQAGGWHGISGAPVFVGDELVGLIKTVPEAFQNNRIAAVPADELFRLPSFRLALARPWIEEVAEPAWVLGLVAEGQSVDDFSTMIAGSIARRANELEARLGQKMRPKPVVAGIADALESAERWLQLVRALCRAPVVVVDVTGFQPATMLALGVRAVVRRGVTITTTSHELDASHLKEFPFNIQESKLVSHGGLHSPDSKKHPLNVLGAAMENGFDELRWRPTYLDLPAYDAVRQPLPERPAKDSIAKSVLMLCSYQPEYKGKYEYMSNIVFNKYPEKDMVRILDLTSPRLVGQALYEYIRWTRTCIVDWTEWRPNVFFEMGVRLASSSIPPVVLIEQSDAAAAADPGQPTQRSKLVQLFNAAVYVYGGAHKPVREALELHDSIAENIRIDQSTEALPFDGTYRTALEAFDWQQERITIQPHELLRRSAELQLGKDRQQKGTVPVLYAANPEYRWALERSVEERWIAAWYYLKHCYDDAQEPQDKAALRDGLSKLGNDVLQAVPARPGDVRIDKLRQEIDAVLVGLEDG